MAFRWQVNRMRKVKRRDTAALISHPNLVLLRCFDGVRLAKGTLDPETRRRSQTAAGVASVGMSLSPESCSLKPRFRARARAWSLTRPSERCCCPSIHFLVPPFFLFRGLPCLPNRSMSVEDQLTQCPPRHELANSKVDFCGAHRQYPGPSNGDAVVDGQQHWIWPGLAQTSQGGHCRVKEQSNWYL